MKTHIQIISDLELRFYSITTVMRVINANEKHYTFNNKGFSALELTMFIKYTRKPQIKS